MAKSENRAVGLLDERAESLFRSIYEKVVLLQPIVGGLDGGRLIPQEVVFNAHHQSNILPTFWVRFRGQCSRLFRKQGTEGGMPTTEGMVFRLPAHRIHHRQEGNGKQARYEGAWRDQDRD